MHFIIPTLNLSISFGKCDINKLKTYHIYTYMSSTSEPFPQAVGFVTTLKFHLNEDEKKIDKFLIKENRKSKELIRV